MRDWQAKGVEAICASIGAKGIAFFRRLKRERSSPRSRIWATTPNVADLIGTVKAMLTLPRRQDRPAVPRAQRVRQHDEPEADGRCSCCPSDRSTRTSCRKHWDYIYEPDAATLLDGVLDALHRVAGLSRRRRERRVRDGRAHGRDEEPPPTTPASSSTNCSSSTTRPARPRSRRRSRRSSAARRPFERGIQINEAQQVSTGKIVQIIGAVIDVRVSARRDPEGLRRAEAQGRRSHARGAAAARRRRRAHDRDGRPKA